MPQWYDARSPVFALEPPDSYFITWLSREQSGFRCLLKTSAEVTVIRILLNHEIRDIPRQNLFRRHSRFTLPSELQHSGLVRSGQCIPRNAIYKLCKPGR